MMVAAPGRRCSAEPPVAVQPVGVVKNADRSLLDAAVAFVVIDARLDAAWLGGVERDFGFGPKRRLVGFDRRQIIGAGVSDRLGAPGVGGDGVDGDEGVLQAVVFGQLRRSAGMAVNSLLLPSTASWPSTSRLAVAKADARCSACLPCPRSWAAARGLAVDSYEVGAVRPRLAHPGGESSREQTWIDPVHQQRQPAPGRNPVVEGPIPAQKPKVRSSPSRDRFVVVAVGDRAANNQKQRLGQRMGEAPRIARILNPAEMIQKRPTTRLLPEFSLHNRHSGPPESVRPTQSPKPQAVNRPQLEFKALGLRAR